MLDQDFSDNSKKIVRCRFPQSPGLNNDVNIFDFKKWVRHRDSKPPKHMPECERVLQVIAAAGSGGISRGDLGQEIQLDRNTLDDLVSAYQRLGQVSVSKENGTEVIRIAQPG